MEKSNNNLIERYVYDVARRLPEKDREDVKKELRANIYDMLPEGAGEDAVKKVLYELGSPASLAEKYRTHPRYLISPAYFDEYLAALKWILPLVGVLVMLIGFAVGAFDAAKSGTQYMPFVIAEILSNGFRMGVSAAFLALVWTTIGFVIAEHGGAKKKKAGEHGWKVEELPEVQNPKAGIPLSEGIAELVLSAVFAVFAILFLTDRLPFAVMFAQSDMVFYHIFSQSFINMLIPIIIVTLFVSVVQAIAKIKDRRWSVLVCTTVVLRKLIDMAFAIYLINQPNILGEEFRRFLVDSGIMNALSVFNGGHVFLIAFCVLIIIGSIAETVKAIKKTVEAHVK